MSSTELAIRLRLRSPTLVEKKEFRVGKENKGSSEVRGERMQNIDRYILVIIIALLLLWGWSLLRRWWNKPQESEWEIEVDEEIPVTAAVELLEQSGYEVMTLKRRVNIRISVDEEQEYQSRLFVDHFARKEDGLYVVKLARERRPMEMTGSGIRDGLMSYALIFNEAEGILYVDPKLGVIHKIQFEINGDKGDDD